MADPRLLPGFVLVALVSAVVLASLLAIGLSRPAASRVGLIAGGLPLALLPPVAATVYISSINLFGSVAEFGAAAAGPLLAVRESFWLLQRIAWGAFSVACLLGLALGLLRFFGPAAGAPASIRRGLVLLLLPCLGLLVATPVTHRLAKGLRVTFGVLTADLSDPEGRARSDAVLEAEGLSTHSSALGATARFAARTSIVGLIGGATVAVILVGLALPGFILAWRVHFGGVFLALGSTLWLLCAAGGILATLGALKPFRFD